MNEFIKIKKIDDKEILVMSSIDVASLLNKDHKDILRMIQGKGKNIGLIPTLLGANLALNDFFIESTYKTANGRTAKCYLCTEMGCQLIGNKQQGAEGILYSARYVQEFNKMKQLINDLQLGKPEAIISLLTWKNSNMETTIRKYVNGSNVLNVLPAIAESCKKQIMNGEMKLEVLATAIRTAKELRENEPNIAYRELYTQAIEKADSIRYKILIGSLGGMKNSKNALQEKCNRLQEKTYNDDDFYDFIEKTLNSKEYEMYKNAIKKYLTYIVNYGGYNGDYRHAYINMYRNVVSRYNNIYAPTSKNEVKRLGYDSIMEYFYSEYGIDLIEEFAAEAQRWAIKSGYDIFNEKEGE